ncbi:MAG: hypothetical protein P4L99_16070 [Chthoniobacter sp.]|nr:hypothetical protein [Chthoniobacter sp.]
MKRLGYFLVLFLVATFAAHGQAPATSKSVYLDVVESTGSSTTVNHWRDISGNFSQTKTSSRELAVTVRNMDAAPGEFEIEWYFFGKPASGTGRFLYDKGSKKVSVAPGASAKLAVDSKELSANTIRDYYYYGYNYTSGDKADGWVIRAKVGEEVIRVKGSNPLLEQTAQDPASFEKITKSTKKTHK